MKKHKRGFDKKTFDEIEKYIYAHFDAPINIASMAATFNCSASTFIRQFKYGTNKNFRDYLLEHRMKYAEKLLLEENKPVAVVASRVGYKSRTGFISAFANFFGRPPGSYLFYFSDDLTETDKIDMNSDKVDIDSDKVDTNSDSR